MKMKYLCWVGIVVLALIVCWILSGCTQTIAYKIETPEWVVTYYKGNALCNFQQYTNLVYDVNSLRLGRYKGEPQKIRALTPYGTISTE